MTSIGGSSPEGQKGGDCVNLENTFGDTRGFFSDVSAGKGRDVNRGEHQDVLKGAAEEPRKFRVGARVRGKAVAGWGRAVREEGMLDVGRVCCE